MKAIGASPGIVIGKIFVKKEVKMEIEKRTIDNKELELEKLHKAKDKAKKQLEEIYEKALKEMGEEEAQVFKAHLLMLDDPELFPTIENKVNSENICCEFALKEVSDEFINMLSMIDNDYMKERAADIKDVRDRVLKIILGVEDSSLSNLSEKVVIAAYDLTPSDTAQMDKDKVIGFITAIGGKTSHTAIMARTLGIPAIVGAGDILSQLKNDDKIVLDGEKGTFEINPDKETEEEYTIKYNKFIEEKKFLEKYINKESVTEDGVHVELAANIGTSDDMDTVLKYGAEGIGLFRTEFLYMNRSDMPSEEVQFEAYKIVLERMNNKPVVIRTLDIGGDKKLDYLDVPEEMNPFLGYRAIRLCCDRQDIFKTQLRALMRASVYGNLKIMFPMISNLMELRQAKEILEEVKEELNKDNIKYSQEVEVGMMIEVPSAAVISDILAEEVDFFSIGTNDLIQYTTAVDRMNQNISHLYKQFHPAVLRLIKMVIDNGHKKGIWVGMCGEAAGDPRMVPVLLGMGLDEFSMSPASIPKARSIICSSKKSELEKHIDRIINTPTAEEIEKYIEDTFMS